MSSSESDHPPPAAVSQRQKKRRRRCACASAESCFACGRCMEQHCVCGAAQRGSVRALCRESRACNCRVHAPAMRCGLCMGCRQPRRSAAVSHCRCDQHQQIARALRDEKKPAARTTTSYSCSCFQDAKYLENFADPHQMKERRKKLACVRRRARLPSCQALYGKKISSPAVVVDELGDHGDELDEVDPEYDYAIEPTPAEELVDAVHPHFILRSLRAGHAVTPQIPISWGRSEPFQQAIVAPSSRLEFATGTNLHAERESGESWFTEAIDRSLENAVFERDRNAAMPAEDLVEYLIFAASVKASRIPELIGSLDNTASTALGIVVEEYMKQLVVRSTREAACDTKRRSVQGFATMVLHEFNYAVYLRQCGLPVLTKLTFEQTQQVTEELVQLVLGEFLAVQHPSEAADLSLPPLMDLLVRYIREVVISELQVAEGQTRPSAENAARSIADLEHIKSVKLSQRTSKVTGRPVFKYQVAADIGERHEATVALDGFESREAAECSIRRMDRVMVAQDKRLTRIENPEVKHEDPVITELYQMIAQQVKQARAQPQTSGGRDERQ